MRQFLYNVRTMGLSDTLRCELRNLALILRVTKISTSVIALLVPNETRGSKWSTPRERLPSGGRAVALYAPSRR
jgi:hypothetical protein